MGIKQYRAWPQGQSYLFPPSPQDWLPDDHLVYFVLDTVELLDIAELEDAIHSKDPRGERPYNPRMMLALLIYAYCTGVFSSRKIARAIDEQVAFRVLTAGQRPHFTSINQCRKQHLAAFRALFVQVLHLCREAGLVRLGHVATDGTRLKANASKHKAMSYGRMKKLQEKLEREIAELLARADTADAEDDTRPGAGQDDVDVPAELRRREDRLAKLRAAKTALEREAKAARAAHERALADGCDDRAQGAATEKERTLNETLAAKHREAADKLSDDDDDPPFVTPDGLPMHRPKSRPDGTPTDGAQRNFTDPDSRIMPSGDGFLQGYNAQAAVDDAHQVIVAAAVTNQAPDSGNLLPMLALSIQNIGDAPLAATADTGFWAPGVERAGEDLGIDVYVALKRTRRGEAPAPPSLGPPPEGADPQTRMDHKLRSPHGRTTYAKRKSTVEPAFGQIKECQGFRHFSLRGLAAATAEWDLVCLTHNLLKLFRYGGHRELTAV